MSAIVLLVVSAACLVVGLRGHQGALPGPASSTPVPTSDLQRSLSATTGLARAVAPSVARSVPVFLRIPAIGVAVSLSTLGINPDGTVQVPTDFAQPGWYRLGPSPGQVGSAVILGHVDSYQGPAVFFQLRSLHSGDAVEVTLADGMVAHFAVTTVAMYTKAEFPAQQVYASHGYAALQLVTCGGQFDRATGHYLSNIVAYTTLVAITPTARPAAVMVR
ncbi:MAG: class F sortase [Actinomycetota bacterium]|nr:class F sortase [Actinomycetota bacterium]